MLFNNLISTDRCRSSGQSNIRAEVFWRVKPTLLLKASCSWSGAAAIIPTKTVSAGLARVRVCRVASALSVMRRDWPILTIRAVCSRCWKSMKMMRSRYCSKANRIWFSKKPGRAVCQNAAAVGVAAGGFARLR